MPNVKLFISYKTDEANLADSTGLSQVAHMLRRELEHVGYDVWMDKIGIEPGKEWDEAIKTAIKECNVFLLLLSDKSATSQWQQREVTTAGNFDKSIIPILVRGGFDAANVLNQNFNMPRTQWLDFRAANEDQYRDLIAVLNKTVTDLKLTPPTGKQIYSNEARPRKEKYATYQLLMRKGKTSSLHPCNIHLAVGDMVKMRGIDVYANTENAYLQMARIFESKTISALLRYHGSNLDVGGRLIEDTVQNELNAIVQQMRWNLPLEIGTVVVTSAGHPSSALRSKTKNNARYIFHTVTVAVEGAGIERKLAPANPTAIENAVVNTLEKVMEVNAENGAISPTGTGLVYRNNEIEDERMRQEKNQDKYQPIKSIILPLFASGHGGLKPVDVMKPVAEGIREFLQDVHDRGDDDKLTLTDIHVSIFSSDHIEPMRTILKSVFEEVAPPDN
jgi:O-acetyl-ADP-ribose deacetylase (regulator of RNase III)